MRLIGGLVAWKQPVGIPQLRAMARSVPGAGVPFYAVRGSVGLFSTLPSDRLESTSDISGVANLDLTNTEELHALTGVGEHGGPLLAGLYALDGQHLVRRLRGAFAFALWDQRQRILLLGVDHFGICRLYYTMNSESIAFASRPSAVVTAPSIDRRVDLTAAFDYLNFGYVPAPRSIYAGVHRLPPGHFLIVRDGSVTLKPYFDLTYSEHHAGRAETAATLDRLTEEAVGRALCGRTTKEVGAFLSGGTDSSTIVGLMGRFVDRVNAFSVGFREEQYDELEYAEISARHFGAAHYTQIVTADDTLEWLPRLVEGYDEPFGNNSAIGTFFCARLAHECGVAALLAGDGGDEIFGGNERYRRDRVFARYHRIPAALRSRVIEPVLRNLGDNVPHIIDRARRYVRRAKIQNPERFYPHEFLMAQEAETLLDADFRAAVDKDAPYAVLRGHYDRAQAAAEVNRLLYLDLKLAIGDNDLLKVTRTAELAGVAVRFPLLDPPLVEFTATWPAEFKVRGLEKRYLFKQAFRTLLAPETLTKRKHGFGVPTSVWLKSHPEFRAMAWDTLLSPRAHQRGYFQAGALERLFECHARDTTPYYGDMLWRVLMLELWHRRYAA